MNICKLIRVGSCEYLQGKYVLVGDTLVVSTLEKLTVYENGQATDEKKDSVVQRVFKNATLLDNVDGEFYNKKAIVEHFYVKNDEIKFIDYVIYLKTE